MPDSLVLSLIGFGAVLTSVSDIAGSIVAGLGLVLCVYQRGEGPDGMG